MMALLLRSKQVLALAMMAQVRRKLGLTLSMRNKPILALSMMGGLK